MRFGHTYSCMMVGFYELRATNHGHCHKPRVTRGDVVILSLCREAAFESEAACELRPAAVDAQLDERFVKGRQRKDYDLA